MHRHSCSWSGGQETRGDGSESEIAAIRALLTAKARPVGWAERRQRLDEVGGIWPVAEDVRCDAADIDGVPGEWSIVPGSFDSRVVLSFMAAGPARARLSVIGGW